MIRRVEKGPFVVFALLLTTSLVAFSATHPETNCSDDPCMYGICLDDGNSSYSCYCIDGYTGANCEINWDDCWSSPCENGGTCNDAIAAYNCSCPEGFLGTNCEQRYNLCASEPCLNNGTCLDAEGTLLCRCLDGYSGQFCEIDASVCNETICKNAGVCLEGPGFSFSCRCPEGWTGEFCEEDVDECVSSPCTNGGLCINVPSSYACACLFGYTGKNCDKPVLSCGENPCENGAVCLLEDERQVCYCVPDYHGSLCELRYDDCESKFANCENGGTCVDGVNDFSCSCPPAFTGPSCEDYRPVVAEPITQTATSETSSDTGGTEETVASSFSLGFTTSSEISSTLVSGSTMASTLLPPPSSTYGTAEEFSETSTAFEPTTSRYSLPPAYPTSATNGYSEVSPLAVTGESNDSSRLTTESSTIGQVSPASQPSSTHAWLASTYETTPTTEETTSTRREGLRNASTSSYDESGFNATERVDTSLGTERTTSVGDASLPTAATTGSFVDAFHGGSPETSSVAFTAASSYGASTDSTPRNQTTRQDCYEGRCVTPESRAECDCERQDKKCWPMMRAGFNGKTYSRYHVDVDVTNEKYAVLSIRTKVRTRFNSGIILHVYFDEERYALLHLEAGSLKFHFSCGARTMLLGEIDALIDNGHETELETKLEYSMDDAGGKCSGKLSFNGTSAIAGEQALPLQTPRDLPKRANLHLGGLPSAFSHYLPRLTVGFVGCMSDLRVNGAPKHFTRDAVETFHLEECTAFLCLPNPCKNFGACEETNGTVRCNCVAGYTGERCERSACEESPCHLGATCLASPAAGFLCVCPLGAHGLLCEEDTGITRPSFSVILPGISSYVAYGLTSSVRDSMELRMTLLPRTIEQISLIAYLGQSGPRRDITDHLSLSYVRGYIMLTWDLGSGVRRIFTGAPLTWTPSIRGYNAWTVRIGRRGRDAWLAVDGIGNVSGTAVGSMSTLDVTPILYIGGHKSRNFANLPHDLPLHSGFSGCIYDVELRTEKAVHIFGHSSPATGRGVSECHRNECIRHSCKNGAVCLNHGPTYSCICSKDWTGLDCSTATQKSSATDAVPCQIDDAQ